MGKLQSSLADIFHIRSLFQFIFASRSFQIQSVHQSVQKFKQAIADTASANVTLSSYHPFGYGGFKLTLFLLGRVIKIKSEKRLHTTTIKLHSCLQQNGNEVRWLSVDHHHHCLPFQLQSFAHLFPSSTFSQ